MLEKFLRKTFNSVNSVEHVYLGLDPWGIVSGQQETAEALQQLTLHIEENDGVLFEIMLPYDEISFWLDKSEEERVQIADAYRQVVRELEIYPNVILYFMGAERWLIANPGNYADGYPNEVISKKIMLYTFCDKEFQVNSNNLEQYLQKLDKVIEEQRNLYNQYPDYSDRQFVFLGDSLIGNYEGSYSIPGVVAGLTNADTYNYGIGGSRASFHVEKTHSFNEVLELFVAGEAWEKENKPFTPDTDRDTYFFILYGFNDYFDGAGIENAEDPMDKQSFKGALRTGVRQLKDHYPEAEVVLLSPNICQLFDGGQSVNSDCGGTLQDYIQAIEEVAQEEDVLFGNAYENLGFTMENVGDYLEDGCHLNEEGRYIFAEFIISLMK